MAFMDVFRPKWKSRDPEKRKSGVAYLTDPHVLAVIATHDTDSRVRAAAVGKLSVLARNDADETAVLSGIETLQDDDELTGLVSFWKMTQRVRHALVDRIGSQSALVDTLVDNAKFEWQEHEAFRRHVVAKIVDSDLLYSVLAGQRSRGRGWVSTVLTNAEKTNIARTIAQVKDDATLFGLVMRLSVIDEYFIVEALISGIKDQSLLKRLAHELRSTESYQQMAIERINDPATLAEIAVSGLPRDPYGNLSCFATAVLAKCSHPTTIAMLLNVFASTSDINVALEAITALMAAPERPPNLRAAAQARLPLLRERLAQEPPCHEELNRDEIWTHSVPNERFERLRTAVAWVEGL